MDWGDTESKEIGGKCQESAELAISRKAGISVASDLRWERREMLKILFVSKYPINLSPVVREVFLLVNSFHRREDTFSRRPC